MKIQTILRAAGGILLIAFAGCASGPQLEKYPRRQIDRPFTLPRGVATWKTPAFLAFSQDSAGATLFIPPVPIPLFWQQSLSDDWQLDWLLFFPTVSHQIVYGDWGYAGVSLGIQGAGYGSASGLILDPVFGGVFRPKLNSSLALNLDLELLPEIKTGLGQMNWRMIFSAGPLFQLSETLEASCGPALSFTQDGSILAPIASGADAIFSARSSNSRLLLQAALGWSFARQWDASLSYQYAVANPTDGSYLHTSVLQFTHFW